MRQHILLQKVWTCKTTEVYGCEKEKMLIYSTWNEGLQPSQSDVWCSKPKISSYLVHIGWKLVEKVDQIWWVDTVCDEWISLIWWADIGEECHTLRMFYFMCWWDWEKGKYDQNLFQRHHNYLKGHRNFEVILLQNKQGLSGMPGSHQEFPDLDWKISHL